MNCTFHFFHIWSKLFLIYRKTKQFRENDLQLLLSFFPRDTLHSAINTYTVQTSNFFFGKSSNCKVNFLRGSSSFSREKNDHYVIVAILVIKFFETRYKAFTLYVHYQNTISKVAKNLNLNYRLYLVHSIKMSFFLWFFEILRKVFKTIFHKSH